MTTVFVSCNLHYGWLWKPVRSADKYCVIWHCLALRNVSVLQAVDHLNLHHLGHSTVLCCHGVYPLTHCGRVTHICVGKLTIISSDNGLSPGQSQAIIWINAGILLIGPLGTNFSEILIEIDTISFKKMHLKMSSGNGGHFVSASIS